MANEILVGLKIGAAVSGTLHAAFGSARSTVQNLGRATDLLSAKQGELGRSLATALASGGAGIGNLRRQYDQVGRTLDQLKLKQERLNASIARGETLKNQRAELRGQAMETAGTALALGAPVVQSVRTAMEFKDQVRDISITGGFDEAEETRLSDVMRGAALKWNQTQAEVAKGTQVLIAGGIADAKELAAYAPVLAKTATATRASMDDLGAVAISMNDSLGIGAAGLDRAMNMLAYAGKRGQFELADMAKWLPQLAPQFAALGITGERAVAEIGASLQIARRGAGSNDEAANNFKNFLAKITAPDTLKSFKDAGIDLQDSMRNLVSGGMTPMQAMLEIITRYMGTKSPAAAGQMQKALALKDDQERKAALERLTEAYKLGDLFRDMQVMSFLRPALANRADQADIQKGSMGAADQGVNDQDWQKRMGSSKEQLKALSISLADIGIAVGGALLPAIVDVTRAIVPMAQQFSAWAGEHPALIKGVVGLVGGLLAGKLAFIGLRYGINLVLSPFNALTTTITTVSSKWTMLRALWQAGRFAPLISGLGRIRGAVVGLLSVGGSVLRVSALIGRGMGMALWAPLKLAAQGAFLLGKIWGGTLLYGLQLGGRGLLLAGRGGLLLGRVLGGSLLTGLRLAGQAVLWLGRALMLNPIGLAITGIAIAAYLIYRYWEPIKGFFSGLWSEIKAGFDGGLVGILGLIANFSPLGLFYRAFAGVMHYFGIELPGKFTEFGGMLVTGLINGIRSMATSAKDAVVGIGESVKSWFTATLGINSPSRVFMGYGANLSEGAAIGITAQQGLVRKAALGMAAATAVNMAPLVLAAPVMEPVTTPERPAPDLRPAAIAIPSIGLHELGLPAVAPRPERSAPDLRPATVAAPSVVPRPISLPAVAPRPERSAPDLEGATMAQAALSAPGMTVHFSPTITVQGAGPNVKEQVNQAMQISFEQFERLMRQYEQRMARRSYGGDR